MLASVSREIEVGRAKVGACAGRLACPWGERFRGGRARTETDESSKREAPTRRRRPAASSGSSNESPRLCRGMVTWEYLPRRQRGRLLKRSSM